MGGGRSWKVSQNQLMKVQELADEKRAGHVAI